MSVRDMVAIIAPHLIREHVCLVGDSPYDSDETCTDHIVRLAMLLEQRVAEHELKEITPPPPLTICKVCGGTWGRIVGAIIHKANCSEVAHSPGFSGQTSEKISQIHCSMCESTDVNLLQDCDTRVFYYQCRACWHRWS